jgi:GT2 family glycosyltransferase
MIIPIKDEWKKAERCVEAIRKYTKESYEVILVDNGSATVSESIFRLPSHRLIRNDWNRGTAAAINQGLAEATGDFMVWLSPDTLPSHRWLGQLLSVLKSDPSIGLVAPLSNKAVPKQKISVPFRVSGKIHRFSNQFNHTDPSLWKEAKRLSSFCVAHSRHLLERVGWLDERFGLGCYEVDDYCYRVGLAGFRIVIAGDTYVHHYGHVYFKKNGYQEFQKICRQNRRYFIHKWGRLLEAEG